jgi:hypothetical protein
LQGNNLSNNKSRAAIVWNQTLGSAALWDYSCFNPNSNSGLAVRYVLDSNVATVSGNLPQF